MLWFKNKKTSSDIDQVSADTYIMINTFWHLRHAIESFCGECVEATSDYTAYNRNGFIYQLYDCPIHNIKIYYEDNQQISICDLSCSDFFDNLEKIKLEFNENIYKVVVNEIQSLIEFYDQTNKKLEKELLEQKNKLIDDIEKKFKKTRG